MIIIREPRGRGRQEVCVESQPAIPPAPLSPAAHPSSSSVDNEAISASKLAISIVIFCLPSPCPPSRPRISPAQRPHTERRTAAARHRSPPRSRLLRPSKRLYQVVGLVSRPPFQAGSGSSTRTRTPFIHPSTPPPPSYTYGYIRIHTYNQAPIRGQDIICVCLAGCLSVCPSFASLRPSTHRHAAPVPTFNCNWAARLTLACIVILPGLTLGPAPGAYSPSSH